MLKPSVEPERTGHLKVEITDSEGKRSCQGRRPDWVEGGPLGAGSPRDLVPTPRQNLHYIFIPSDIRDYVMLRSTILGVPVPEGTDKGDR